MTKIISVTSGDFIIEVADPGRLIINGNLSVLGDSTYISTTNLEVTDNILILNKGESPTNDGISAMVAGISIDRGSLPSANLLFDESLNVINSTQKGAFNFVDKNGDSIGIYTNKISTLSDQDLNLIGQGDGVVSVSGTNNYERHVFKYVNDKIDINNLFLPLHDDALVNAKLLSDYIQTYNENYWSPTKITSPAPDGNTLVEVQSIAAGDVANRAIIVIDSKQVAQFAKTLIQIDADLQLNVGSSIVNTTFADGIISNSSIVFKDSLIAGVVPTVENTVNASIYVNSADGKLFFRQPTRVREVGMADRVANVYYVSNDSGNDNNDGTTLSDPFKTIDAALSWIAAVRATQTEDEYRSITVFVKSGSYVLTNPVKVPPRVSLVGDNLRTVDVRPLNRTQDMFWVNNGSYLTHMTFRDHLSPAAAVAFSPDLSAGFISQSPYVQNCTSITTTGTGMRVDGAHALGLKSMVVDAFTQYNQGGIGIHMLNRGNTQLVSVFTICCDVGFLCESGGFCSITNSNSSFGNYALKANGVSTAMYVGRVSSQIQTNQFKIDKLIKKPNIGDAVKFDGVDTYYTVASVQDLFVNSYDIESANYAGQSAALVTERNTVLAAKSFIQRETIRFLTKEYPFFTYDEAKCSRDVGIIVDSAINDAIFNTNYQSIKAANSYYRAMAALVLGEQKTETIAAIEFAKQLTLSFMNSGLSLYARVNNNFATIIDIMQNGESAAPAIDFNVTDVVGISAAETNARNNLQLNRQYLIEEGSAYLAQMYPALVYNTTACRRDIGIIVDAITYDVLYEGNSQTSDAVRTYFNSGSLQIPEAQIQPSVAMFAHLKIVAKEIIVNSVATLRYTNLTQNTTGAATASASEQSVLEELFNVVTNMLDNGYNSIVTLEEEIAEGVIPVGTAITFHQLSLITSSGHTFEWIGAGTDVNTALPYLGGTPIEANQVIQENGGRVYFTGTDQKGDFSIGTGLKINRAKGTIEGRVFRRSLYSTLTPYILALGEG